MSRDETDAGAQCHRYADGLAELALGIATGRDRAETLAHVGSCPACQAEMEQLALAADAMLEVIPGVEPPLGFEVRLAERLRAGRAPRQAAPVRWWSRRPSPALACLLAVLALVIGAGAGWLVRGGHTPATGRASFGTGAGGSVSSRPLASGGHELGYVTVYSGAAPGSGWLFMSLDVGSWSGAASCRIRLADGRDVVLGTFWLDHGYGAWGVSLAPGTGRIRSAEVVDAKGVLATADFSPVPVTSGPAGGGYAGLSAS